MIVTLVDLPNPRPNWTFLRPMGDLHLGNVRCREARIRADLEEARSLNARILLIGDIYDAILTKDHKRFALTVLKPFLQERQDLLNAVVEYGVSFLEPYADLIDVMGYGNHEAAVLKHHNFDLIKDTVGRLNEGLRRKGNDHRIAAGGYTGYVQYRVPSSTAKPEFKRSLNVLYNHGGGGDAPVTKGILDISRKTVNWDYDLYVYGHKHHSIIVNDVKIRLTGKGVLQIRTVKAVQCGSYFQNYDIDAEPGAFPFTESQNHAPKPIGSPIVRFKFSTDKNPLIKVEQ